MESPNIECGTLTIEQAAKRLGIPRSSAYELVARNQFPTPVIYAGRRRYVSRVLVERLIDPDPGIANSDEPASDDIGNAGTAVQSWPERSRR